MRKSIKNESGEFAIDAVLGITFFMVSLTALMFICLIVRVQSNIQYALGQTAKEVSGYYYLVDKVGLAAATTGTDKKTDVDETIKSVVDFSGSLKDTANSTIQLSEGDISSMKDAADNAQESYKIFTNDVLPKVRALDGDSVTQVLSVFAKTAVNRAIGFYLAPLICEKLMPKYLSSQKFNNIDEYYEAVGISNVDFTGSEFLTDGRSIKIQVTYDLDISKYTLGFVKRTVTFRQVASTAAWVRPDGNDLKALSELGYDEKEAK